MSLTYKEVLPDAERVIEGLQIRLRIETSIEDIIDNSISADATKIDVHVDMDYGGNIMVSIADNGYGMSHEELINAMRYGSRIRPNPASLGKFGLGLKTASTAFCRKLSVISKNNDSSGYSKATWDLDHVSEVGKWELGISDATDEDLERLQSIADGGSGTLVTWEKVDRLLKTYSDPGGTHARKALEKKIDDLKEHVSMVYQRFIDCNDPRAENHEIRINGEKLELYIPFCPDESDLVAEETISVEINGDKNAEFKVKAYVLPRKEEFSSTEAHEHSRLSNDNQGMYVYRENRLIYGPGWLHMYSKEPHMSLLRVEFSFDHRLDDAFHIDIKKSQIILNEDLRDWLKKFLTPCRRAAEQKYRQGKKKEASEASKTMHDSSNANIHSKAPEVSESTITIVDEPRGEVDIKNKHGTTRKIIKMVPPERQGSVHVQTVPYVDDGLLWEPTLVENNKAVKINTGHEYYSKVYLPNKNSSVTVQGLDSLLWALCEAEYSTMNDKTVEFFEEMRREVSRILRVLVKDLPEPDNDVSEE